MTVEARLEVTPEYRALFSDMMAKVSNEGIITFGSDNENLTFSFAEGDNRSDKKEVFAIYEVSSLFNNEDASLTQSFILTESGVRFYSSVFSSPFAAKTLSLDVRTGLFSAEQVRETPQARERRQEDGDALAALLLRAFDKLKGFPIATNGSSSE